MDHRKAYVGVFMVALATLVLEILLTRITSVVAWYHLAFFVISLAMLGMTAGAVIVFVRPAAFTDALVPRRATQACLALAATAPLAIAAALWVPLSPITTTEAARACGFPPITFPDGSHHASFAMLKSNGNFVPLKNMDCLTRALPEHSAFQVEFILHHFRDIAIGLIKGKMLAQVRHEGVQTFLTRVASGEVVVGN